MFCLMPSILLDVAVLFFCLNWRSVDHVVVCFDDVYVALCCVYFAACYSALLYLFFVLDVARGCFILPMLLDAATCLSHSFYFARCCCFASLLVFALCWQCCSMFR